VIPVHSGNDALIAVLPPAGTLLQESGRPNRHSSSSPLLKKKIYLSNHDIPSLFCFGDGIFFSQQCIALFGREIMYK
jgi:hypothetical protein